MSKQPSIPYLLLTLHREFGIPLWVLVRSVCNESVPLTDRVSEFLYPEDVARLEEFSRSKPSVSSVMSQLLTISGINPSPSSVPQFLIPTLLRALSTYTPRGLTLAFGNWVSFPS